MNGDPPDALAGAEGEGAAAMDDGASEGQLHASVPRPEPRIPYARAHAPSSAPSRRKGTIPGAASAPPTSGEEAYPGSIPAPAPLPRMPDVERIVARAGQEAASAPPADAADSSVSSRRRSRRVVKVSDEPPPLAEPGWGFDGPATVALPIDTPAAISAPSPEVSDDDWTSPEPTEVAQAPAAAEPIPTPEAPPFEPIVRASDAAPSASAEPRPPADESAAATEARHQAGDVPNPLARTSVPRPAPRPVSLRRPSGTPEAPPPVYITDPDSVAVIRPIQIINVESDLPPVASALEPVAEASYVEDTDDLTALPLRFVSDGPTPLDPASELGLGVYDGVHEESEPVNGRDDGPPTARDWQPDPGVRTSAPDLTEWAAAWATSPPPPEEAGARTSVDEIEAEPLEEDELEPRSDGEPLEEVEPERDSDSGEEIPIDMVDEPEAHPKKPPPPPPRRGRPPAPASPELPAYASPVPSAASVGGETPRPALATPPPAAPAAPAAARTPTEPSPPASEAVRRQKPWWEDLFGDDFIRTLDKLEPKVVRHEVDFIDERLGVEKGAVILDLACGAGAHAVEMASRGYSIVGYDLSLAMLARAADEAQDRGQKLNFLHGDMREMAFEGTFDAVYCWSTSFGYFDEEKNADVLHRIRRALRTGGMLLLDVINRDYVACRQPSLVWFEGDGCVCMDEMQVDFFSSRLKVKRTVMFEDGHSRELDYSIRLYNLHEMGKLLHEAGFKVTEVTGHPAHPGVFFGSESPRLIILAERS